VTFAMMSAGNHDPAEIARFDATAQRWWDPQGEFRPLHVLNPVRLDYIDERIGGLKGRRVLDVGCGGGLLSEAMARRGDNVDVNYMMHLRPAG
jgi:2-polyprenyl-6-hydroxyphenyl methylase/3-demethylubiquinone-9 3-methyltransferase